MEKEITEILKGDYLARFKNYLSNTPILNNTVKVDDNYIQLVTGEIPPVEVLLDGASGKVSEKVLFEGIFGHCIVELIGKGKIPLEVLDNTVNSLANSYDELKKHLPVIVIKEEAEEN